MTQDVGTNGHSNICQPNIVSAGLPMRSEVILAREKNIFPMIVAGLQGNRKGIPVNGIKLTVEILEQSFKSEDSLILSNAAFLAGRCHSNTTGFQDNVKKLLHQLISSISRSSLDIMDSTYIQAVMSLALLGEAEKAHRLLLEIIDENITEGYLAAFYLAQLGDPSGYPLILKNLSSSNEHYRLMASRHLIGFKPYKNQIIQGKTIDIVRELLQRLKDKSTYVRQEIPHLLVEAGAENLKETLIEISKNDKNRNVRQAAIEELEQLQ
jgi:HEAT repeat protein